MKFLDLVVLFILLVFLASVVGCGKSSGGNALDETKSIIWWDNFFRTPPETNLQLNVNDQRGKELRERGGYLSKTSACGYCHASDLGNQKLHLAGGAKLEDSHGEIFAPNITPDKDTGIGSWSTSEIMNAIRTSIGKGDKKLSVDVHRGYRWLSDEDAKALALYISSLEPVRNLVERRKLSGFSRRRLGIFSEHETQNGYLPSPPRKSVWQYGRYLAIHVAQCSSCHSKNNSHDTDGNDFSGRTGSGKGIVSAVKDLGKLFTPNENDNLGGEVLSEEGFAEVKPEVANLKQKSLKKSNQKNEHSRVTKKFPGLGPDIRGSSGLAGWSEEQISAYLTTGRTAVGKSVSVDDCPWDYYRAMTPGDKLAIAAFLSRL